MNNWDLWHTFERSGRVEDYLRYRGIQSTEAAVSAVQEERMAYGDRPKTASDDRRADRPGV